MDARATDFWEPAPPRPAPSAGPAGAARPAYRAELRSPAALEADLEAWRALARRAVEPNPFLEPDLLTPALRHLPEARHVALLLVRDASEPGVLRGLFPLTTSRLPFAPTSARLWRPPAAPTGAPLVDGADPVGTVAAALAALAGRGGRPGHLLFPDVAEGGPFAAALLQLAAERRHPVSLVPRRNRQAARLDGGSRSAAIAPGPDDLHGAEVRRAREGRAVRDAVEEFLALEAAGPRGRQGTALIQEAAAASFFRTATRQLARRRRCHVDVLQLDGAVLAAAVVVEGGDRTFLWRLAAEESERGLLAGRRLALELARGAPGRARRMLLACPRETDLFGLDGIWPGAAGSVDLRIGLRPASPVAGVAALAADRIRRRMGAALNAVAPRPALEANRRLPS